MPLPVSFLPWPLVVLLWVDGMCCSRPSAPSVLVLGSAWRQWAPEVASEIVDMQAGLLLTTRHPRGATASNRGPESEVAHKWARWLHNPCRLGGGPGVPHHPPTPPLCFFMLSLTISQKTFISAPLETRQPGGEGGAARPTHRGNAETTPARAPAAVADRKQRPDATCEGKNG